MPVEQIYSPSLEAVGAVAPKLSVGTWIQRTALDGVTNDLFLLCERGNI